MSQSTNLNKNPYYDDFSDSKNFYKVLFKPGVTVQTRELTTLQSILQNQIEKLGSSFIKKNSVVVPGGFAHDLSFYAVEVESTYKGIEVESYFEKLVGATLTGRVSNITAKIEKVLSKSESVNSNTTFYIKYQKSSSTSFTSGVFSDGEELIVNEDVVLNSGLISSGSVVAKTIAPTNRTSTSIGSAAKIDSGIYFVRGFFVNVSSETIILDQYSNTPSYRVGLSINEEIVSVEQDSSLYDNAQGFPNYAAPGADRLKISLSLSKKNLNDFNDENFIELFRIENGVTTQIKNNTESSLIDEILARRTFDESGNYYVNAFNVEALESLNDNLGNGGLYQVGGGTSSIVASENTGVIKVSPGKAYIKGYEVTTDTALLNFPKPRTTKHVESSSSSFNTGNLVRVNHVKNVPNVGLTTDLTVNLYNLRLVNGGAAGTLVGIARVYNISPHITSFEGSASQFDLNLFDIQTYSKIISDVSLANISVGDHIKGNNSGATAFVKDKNSQTLTVYQNSGNFILNETLIVNGIGSTVSVGTFTSYSVQDIKSIHKEIVAGVSTFHADTVLSKQIPISGPFNLVVDSGIGTITANNGASFASILNVSDVIKYSQAGVGSDIYARISEISNTKSNITIRTVDTVPGVCSGNLGVSTSLQTISVIRPEIIQSDDPSLTAKLNHKDIANIDFQNSNIYATVPYSALTKSSTTLTLPSLSGTDYVYASFNPERYIVSNANGSLENLSTATFTITNGGKNAEFTNLSSTAGPCRVITTQIKSNVSQKYKKLSRCNSLIVSRTKYSTPKNVGLTSSMVYGTRVEDDQISLNVADVLAIQGIFESSTTSTPAVPWITISGLNSTNSNADDLIIGELVIGSTSGAVAVYAEKKGGSEIYVIDKNLRKFVLGESVRFSESGYTATVTSINPGDKNIIDEFILDNGQRNHFYDFSRIIRKDGSREPAARLKIYFDRFTFDPTDNGDLISSNSYPSTLSKSKIPQFNGNRNSDVIDIRPRVANYSLSSTISPFDFSSRSFNTSSNNAGQVLSTNENFVFDYDFYLPRIDKVTLSKDKTFNVIFGDPSESPVEPIISNEVLDIATIFSSAYVYDIKEDITIQLSDHKRYTMSDLRDIEDRVSNLEYYTSLSLLEKTTENLLITDNFGLNRFKCGFFVDEFRDYNTSDIDNLNYNALIENKTLSAPKNSERIDLSLFYTDNYTPLSNINLSDTTCDNLKLTGDKLSLNYSEVVASQQPFASKVVNVNPFNIITWTGNLELSPSKDIWTTTIDERSQRRGRGRTQTLTRTQAASNIRTRNIEFISARVKPNTRFKLLFDKRDLTSNTLNSTAFPKLIEITSNVGSFQVGETVNCLDNNGKVVGIFRVCSPNHKSGPIDSPTSKFAKNPYNPSVGISSQYGPQSTILNIDTESLSRSDISGFWGKIEVGNKITGATSKANAIVSDVRLISNEEGSLLGSIWIDKEDKFTVGQSSVELVLNTPTQKVAGEVADSSSSAVFTSSGTEIVNTIVTWADPLAQTFLVEDENGIIPTSVDVYFYTKDSNIPVELQIRETSSGIPGGSDKIVPGLRKVLPASSVNVSSNASVKTTFTFDTLTRLPAGEYSLVLISDSNEYQVWISEIGSEDISTVNLPTINKVFITKQPHLGTLFKSQNASTWVPSPLEDLKFTLNKASFISSGTARFYNSTVNTKSEENRLPSNPITAISTSGSYPNTGRHILVFHPNHGMHSPNDKVEILGVQSDILPQKLTVAYASSETGAISVDSVSIFSEFEDSVVYEDNPGYIKIGNEIIGYKNYDVGTNTLSTITRGAFGTIPANHSVGDLVYKYEFNNVSLARINTEFTIESDPKPTLDSYYVQIGAGSSFTSTKTSGGDDVYASKNKKFSDIQLNESFVKTFNDTQVSASVRTITSTSVGGSEVSFVDNGTEIIGINSTNKLNSPRMVASRLNETTYLNSTNFIGNKSLTLELNLSTSDSNVSPIIDLKQPYLVGSVYRINQPVGLSSYSSDNRVNSNTEDPHSFVHISNRVDLEQAASSLKVLFSAYRNQASDIRVLYKIFTNDSPDNDQIWQLFPGYENLDVNGNVIDYDDNDGRPDVNVRSSLSDEYLEYSFTIDNLALFTGFQIKIVGTSSNQAYSPLIEELRVIALK